MALDSDKLVRNSTLTVIARLAMLAMPILIGALAFTLSRAVNSIDAMSAEVVKSGTQIKLLEQAIKFGFDANKAEVAAIRAQLTDHEGRLRIIERTTPPLRATP